MKFISKGMDDAEELSEYLHPIWCEVFGPLMSPGEAEYKFNSWYDPEGIRNMFSEGYEIGYIFEDDTRVGLYSYNIQDDGRFHISKLYLEKAYRGKGLGRRALEMMFDIARDSGCTEAYLEVYHSNTRAFEMYLKAGMTDYTRYREEAGNGYYRDGYTMVKHL